MGKYNHLAKTIPVQAKQEPEHVEALKAEMSKCSDKTAAQLAQEYNQKQTKLDEITKSQIEPLKIELKAREILLRSYINGEDAEAVKLDGYTWSEAYEPYPVAEDPEAIVTYFKEHGMEDQLVLTRSELASRLAKIVKEEALGNTLHISQKEIIDPETGEAKTVTDVRSNVTGVRVFLAPKLSRVKSSRS